MSHSPADIQHGEMNRSDEVEGPLNLFNLGRLRQYVPGQVVLGAMGMRRPPSGVLHTSDEDVVLGDLP